MDTGFSDTDSFDRLRINNTDTRLRGYKFFIATEDAESAEHAESF